MAKEKCQTRLTGVHFGWWSFSPRANSGRRPTCVEAVVGILTVWMSCSAYAAAPRPDTGTAGDATIVQMARREFGTLTRAEQALFEALDTGTAVRFVSKEPNNVDFTMASTWSPDRTIHADRITWVCSNAEAVKLVGRTGVSITGVHVDGNIRLESIQIPFPLVFDNCLLSGGISLARASSPLIALSHTRCRTIQARNLEVGDLYIRRGCQIPEGLDASEATVDGEMDLSDSHFQERV